MYPYCSKYIFFFVFRTFCISFFFKKKIKTILVACPHFALKILETSITCFSFIFLLFFSSSCSKRISSWFQKCYHKFNPTVGLGKYEIWVYVENYFNIAIWFRISRDIIENSVRPFFIGQQGFFSSNGRDIQVFNNFLRKSKKGKTSFLVYSFGSCALQFIFFCNFIKKLLKNWISLPFEEIKLLPNEDRDGWVASLRKI